MSVLHYLTHPDVRVDPEIPVPDWGLDERGRARAEAMAALPWVARIRTVVSSPERKARETAAVLAARSGLDVEVREATGEIDRSATGFVPHDRHEQLADALFARPDVSAGGWETARAAQGRIVAALGDLLDEDPGIADGDVAVVGHGGVGTLLLCHVAGWEVSRERDQPGQGHRWAYERATRTLLQGWRPIEEPG